MKAIKDFFIFIISIIGLFVVIVGAILLSMPDVGQLSKCFTTSMFKVKLCPESNNYTKMNSISPYVVHAVIAAEDGSFYHHKGFDWHEIQESFSTNLLAGKMRRGGSTLTQQLAKNAFLNQEKSLLRKAREAYLAYMIEVRYKKDLILEKYLNIVEFGPNLYGVKAASQHYFHKHPSELHPLEAAYLAHLLPNPKAYSRSANSGTLTAFNKKMIKIILNRMASFGKLSSSARQTAHDNIDSFPWSHLSKDSFQGTPTYNLDAPNITSDDFEDMQLDEESLEEIIKENEHQGIKRDSSGDME